MRFRFRFRFRFSSILRGLDDISKPFGRDQECRAHREVDLDGVHIDVHIRIGPGVAS